MNRKLRRRDVRAIAREAYIESVGDLVKAEHIVRNKLKAKYGFVDLAFIAAVLQICWLLWQFWQSFNLSEPPNDPMEGEPDVELADDELG